MRSTRAAGVALIASLLGFAACTTFSGLTVPEEDASTGLDGSPPHNDSAPPPNDAPSSPEADAGPSVLGFLSIQDAARVCSRLDKCSVLGKSITYSIAVALDPVNYSLCMDTLAGPIPPSHVGTVLQSATFACLAKQTTCTGAGACLSQEFLETTDTRCNKVPKDAGPDANPGVYQYCDTDAQALFRCDPQYTFDVLHCQTGFFGPSATCTQTPDGTYTCASGTDCPTTSCSGNQLTYCSASGLHIVTNCASLGQVCGADVTDDAGGLGCLTSDRLKTCTAAGSDCDNRIVSVCDGFDRAEFDCQALGGTCTKSAGSARCQRPNDECVPEDPKINVCTGSKISLCVGGKASTFDCASVGLGCVPGTAALSGRCG
jgi:hypothetical protein